MKNRPNKRSDLRRRAEALLEEEPSPQSSPQTDADVRRLLHELQVHQLELEMQNSELREARDEAELQLGRYTDLYDFAPVGYFSVNEQGLILDVNLTGAALLGVERSRLINRHLFGFVAPKSLNLLKTFLQRVFAAAERQSSVVSLLTEHGATFWADLQATLASTGEGTERWCRVAISDLTTLKQAEEVLQRVEGLASANRELKIEIVHRQTAEAALKKGEAEARQMQEQLRHLSHKLLLSQEEERKRISRELHDEIVQTLVGINVNLSSLSIGSSVNVKVLKTKIARTQQLVERSVETVHRFARELRPTVLDDLGLIPALQSFVKEFSQRTKISVQFEACTEVEQLNSTERTVLYRVTQSALANVDKHAYARNASVRIRKNKNTISLEIHDDGKSFKVGSVLIATRHERLGLIGSRERIEMVGGRFTIESAPLKGTTIRAEIPIKRVPSPRRKDNC